MDIDREVGPPPEGAGDDVAKRVAAGLLGRDHAALDLLVDPGVIGGEEGHRTVPPEVDPAVPHVGDVRGLTIHEHRRHRRGHALVVRALPGRLQQPPVGMTDRGLEPVAVVGDRLVEPEGGADRLPDREALAAFDNDGGLQARPNLGSLSDRTRRQGQKSDDQDETARKS